MEAFFSRLIDHVYSAQGVSVEAESAKPLDEGSTEGENKSAACASAPFAAQTLPDSSAKRSRISLTSLWDFCRS